MIGNVGGFEMLLDLKGRKSGRAWSVAENGEFRH